MTATARRPAVFLDRDGVINRDTGYPHRADDLVFTATAVEGIRLLNDRGVLVVVVTNQSGVARGMFGLDAVAAFHAAMQARLAEHGAHIDRFYVAPWHPEATVAEFRADHEDRKPGSGMLRRALSELSIDPARSVMIGDRDSDMQAAAGVDVAGIHVPTDACDLAATIRDWLEKGQACGPT